MAGKAATKAAAAKTSASGSVRKPAARTVAGTAAGAIVKPAAKAARKVAQKVAKKAVKKAAPATEAKGVKTSAAKGAVKGSVKGVVKTSGKQAPNQAPKPALPAVGPKAPKAVKKAAVKPHTKAPVTKAPQAADTGPGHEPGSALDAAHKAAAILFAKKAEDVVLMDLRELSTVADYYLIATCTNEPQMRAILNTLQRSLSREGIKSLRSEYMPGVRWAVVDYGDLIVHLFEKQTRGFYSLERLWADAPSTTLNATDYALPADDHETDMDEDGDL